MTTENTSIAHGGFVYFLEITHPDGRVEVDGPHHNVLPIQGINHMLGVTFKSVGQVASWYMAIYEGNYTPTSDLTAATFPSLATECTAYTLATRPIFASGAVANGSLDNSASRAEYTMTAPKTVYGMAILSSSVKAAVTGVAASAVRFSSPKVLETGAILRVIAGVSIISN